MNPVLIEPTDILFFRDAVPMAAGQGKGAGCRLPFPSTLHEAFRASLLRANGITAPAKNKPGRPRHADRTGDWHSQGHDGQTFIATKAFRSLRTLGPLPWRDDTGILLPVPLDVACHNDRLARLELKRDLEIPARPGRPVTRPGFAPPCVPVSITPPDKQGVLAGWWTGEQMLHYLSAPQQRTDPGFKTTLTSSLWAAEHRVGVEIDPSSFASKKGQLYAGTYLRAHRETRFVAWTEVADPGQARNAEAEARHRERTQLAELDWLLVGGEFRLARLWHKQSSGKPLPDPLPMLRAVPSAPRGDGPCLLKWVLVTPAIFAQGSLPGWCCDTKKARPGGPLPVGLVCLDLPGRAHVVSWCLGKPRTVSGWDVVEGRAKPTLLAVPEGSVYYFLCENPATAAALAGRLHWQPRSDFYGEKGCGYGLVSFDVRMHSTSPDVSALASELFQQ